MLHRIMAEDEMRNVHTLAIVLNCEENSKVYHQIFSKDQDACNFIDHMNDKVKPKTNGEDHDPL